MVMHSLFITKAGPSEVITLDWVKTLLLLASMMLVTPALWCQSSVDFNRDIRPILSEHCFRCHGPDAKSREADLRLDSVKAMKADLGGYSAVVPGNPKSSILLARINHTSPDERMPPVETGKKLTSDQINLITSWVQQGAEGKKHWSFIRPVRPELAVDPSDRWSKNEIDQFILAKLQQYQKSPSAQAAAQTLIRRVTLDLTGLPPSIDEINAFLSDTSKDAYENVVDRLLDSPHYGERMAMQWLDASRYADTHGYSLDRRRVMWPWRDWVIWAYNQNMPFDQFMVEQLAGDLLPDAKKSQIVATGFNRNHPIQSEGGVINEEYRVETVVDRVETTASVFLGLTMGCCRCHDHKYEPISQTDFFGFYAFFNNVPESAHVGNGDRLTDGPVIKAPSVLQPQQLQGVRQRIVELEKKISAESRLPNRKPVPLERVWIDDKIPESSTSIGNGSGVQRFEFVSKNQHPVFSGKMSSLRTSVGLGQHLVQNANPPLRLNQSAKLFCYVYLDPKNPPDEIMMQWFSGGKWEHRAYWGKNQIDWGADKTASRRLMGPLPNVGQWTRLEVAADQIGLGPGSEITGWAFTQFGGTVYWDKAGVLDLQTSQSQKTLTSLNKQADRIQAAMPTVMVMAEKKPPRKTLFLDRGQYDSPTDLEVKPGLPAAFGELKTDDRANRLDLAKWLSGPRNPLTARVTVNRLWKLHFGTGIVKTLEDFGSQGEWPSHPKLLDWLACEFVESGWDVKSMHKKIVMSATYQQDSRWSGDSSSFDPGNRLLGRGPRFRLEAEIIRDQALSLSGLLVDQIGGPSVRPYQPAGLWRDVVYENAPRFQQDHGDSLYRRSLYTYWKRSVPPPNFQAFDAPTREACTLTRSMTNTPMAALVLMNDPTFVEASRKLAERVLNEIDENTQKRLNHLFRIVTGREPSLAESKSMTKAYVDLHNEFKNNRSAALELMKVGEAATDPRLEVTELAAFTSIANALLQTDETITRN